MNIRTHIKGKNVTLVLVTSIALYGCGGGDGDPPPVGSSSSSVSASSPSSVSSSSSSSASSVTIQQRTQAATQTAQNNSSCTPIQLFYWEIGDHTSMIAGATAGNGDTTPNATTTMLIAS